MIKKTPPLCCVNSLDQICRNQKLTNVPFKNWFRKKYIHSRLGRFYLELFLLVC